MDTENDNDAPVSLEQQSVIRAYIAVYRRKKAPSDQRDLKLLPFFRRFQESPHFDKRILFGIEEKAAYEKLRKFVKQVPQEHSPILLNSLRKFLVQATVLPLEKLEASERFRASFIALHTSIGDSSDAAKMRLKSLEGTLFSVKKYRASILSTELKFFPVSDQSLIYSVTEKFSRDIGAVNRRAGEFPDGSDIKGGLRSGYAFIAKGTRSVHMYLRGRDDLDRVSYYETLFTDGGSQVLLLRLGPEREWRTEGHDVGDIEKVLHIFSGKT